MFSQGRQLAIFILAPVDGPVGLDDALEKVLALINGFEIVHPGRLRLYGGLEYQVFI